MASTKNKFQQFACFANDSDSGEDIQNIDPDTYIQQATAAAAKQAKAYAKEKAAADRKAAMEAATKVAEVKEEKPKREPRANNQRRYGTRNDDRRRNDRGDGEVQNKEGGEIRENNRDRRQNRRPRDQDRKSGTGQGRKAVEKRGGAGKGNWGEATENQEENLEKVTEEPVDNNDDAEAEEAEVQPKEEIFSLEEYYQSLAVDQPAAAKEPVRKANDGVELKGTVAAQKQLYNDGSNRRRAAPQVESNKKIIDASQLGFQSERRNRRNNDNRNYNRNNNDADKNQPQDFSQIAEDAFPSLGGK